MSNLVGQDIGRYHVIEQLGQGGMAVVYKAYDSRLERNVAIKVIRFAQEPQDRFLKRFDREAKSLAQLQHTNIVNVIDYGEHQGDPYLVMEYVPGGTLKQYQGKAIPFPEAARMLAPIARALAYAHQNNIIHRDVKPANILITASGQSMLSDFGVAKLLTAEETEQLTGTGIGVGTPEYMAPEQWLGTVGTFTDIYALGVVFYELVTGRRPFMADTPAAVLLKAVNEPLPRPRTFVPSLPEEVEQVIFKALAKKPEDRFEDMGAFARALEKIERLESTPFPKVEQPVVSEEPPVETRDELSSPAKSKRTKPKILIAAVAIVLIGILTMVVLFIKGQPVKLVSSENITPTVEASATPEPAATEGPTVTQVPTIPVAAATKIGRGKGDLLFSENFESGVYSQFRDVNGFWQIVNDETGNKVVEVDNSERNGSSGVYFGSKDWKDYIIEYRIRFLYIAKNQKPMIALYYRCDGVMKPRYNAAFFPFYKAFSFQYGDDNTGTFKDLNWVDNPVNLNQWYTVSLEVRGSNFKQFIDDKQIAEANDDALPSGSFAFYIGEYVKVQIDDINVYEVK